MKTTNTLFPIDAARALVRTARSGIYLVRGLDLELQRSARARAARERTTLGTVLREALREYAAGTWTPRTTYTSP